ncbi:MAG: hypothetical protein V9G98_08350 [Candidatus Competibacter sp.]
MNYTLPLEGDLILSRAKSGAKANLTGQKLLRKGRQSSASHVALVASPAYLIHATPADGVHFIGIHEFLCKSEYSEHWQVFRLNELTNRVANDHWGTRTAVGKACDYFLLQKYNYLIHVGGNKIQRLTKNRSFCSQLAASTYQRLEVATGLQIEDIEKTLPIDFEDAVRDTTIWTNVTDFYRSTMESVLSDEQLLEVLIENERLNASIAKKQILLECHLVSKLLEVAAFVRRTENRFGRLEALVKQHANFVGIPVSVPTFGRNSLSALDAALTIVREQNWVAGEQYDVFKKIQDIGNDG